MGSNIKVNLDGTSVLCCWALLTIVPLQNNGVVRGRLASFSPEVASVSGLIGV